MLKATYGGVAQLGERTVRIRKVESSNLFVSTKANNPTTNIGGIIAFFACNTYYQLTVYL